MSNKQKGTVFFKMQKYEKAIQCYRAFILQTDLEQQKKICHSNISVCLFKLKKFHECIQQCNMTLRLQNNFIKANYFKAKSHKELKEYYHAYINALQFVNNTSSQEQKTQMMKIMVICRSNLNTLTVLNNKKTKLTKTFTVELQNDQNPQQIGVQQYEKDENYQDAINVSYKKLINSQQVQQKLAIQTKIKQLIQKKKTKRQQQEGLIQYKSDSDIKVQNQQHMINSLRSLKDSIESNKRDQQSYQLLKQPEDQQKIPTEKLCEHFILRHLTNTSADFDKIYQITLQMLENKKLTDLQKTLICTALPKQLPKFNVYIRSLSKQQKSTLNESFKNNKLENLRPNSLKQL